MSADAHACLSPETVPQLDLAAQYAAIGGEIRAAVERVLASQQFIFGREGAAFEKEVAQFCGLAHGVGVGSGTPPRRRAARPCRVPALDHVITHPVTLVG